jgi:hypothetical protein
VVVVLHSAVELQELAVQVVVVMDQQQLLQHQVQLTQALAVVVLKEQAQQLVATVVQVW